MYTKQVHLSQERLHMLVHYDPNTGFFTRRVAAGNRSAGERTGAKTVTGHRTIMVDKHVYPEHRLAWFYMYGSMPVGDIDHINRVRDDNRIANLRPATRAQNRANSGPFRTNTSGFKGVTAAGNRWKAQMEVRGRSRVIGRFDTREEAAAAYKAAALKIYGEFAEEQSQ